MTLTILELLYIVLALFVAVIGTLLTIILVRVIKILGPIMEIVNLYNKVKQILELYASIPQTIVDWVKDSIAGVVEEKEEKQEK